MAEVDTMTAYVPTEDDFKLKDNTENIAIDNNFASQSYWKEVRKKFFHNKGAVVGLAFVIILTI